MFQPEAIERPRRWSLLQLDPELADLVDETARLRAQHELAVGCAALRTGLWDVGRLRDASCAHAGLLILDGVVAREVVIGGEVSSELLGAGDLIRPWAADVGEGLMASEVRWNVLADGRVAILDAAFLAHAAAFPGVTAMLMERIEARARRLAAAKAISQITRVDHRLLAMFRHLCERWGKVTTEGVALPLCLSHRMLGELIGARRPTVSTAAAA